MNLSVTEKDVSDLLSVRILEIQFGRGLVPWNHSTRKSVAFSTKISSHNGNHCG